MRSILFMVFTFLSLSSWAQNLGSMPTCVIDGNVIDGKNDLPLEMANVRLYSTIDSSYIAGIATNQFGHFNIKVEADEFVLEISYLGYKKNTRIIKVETSQKTINLEKIILEEDENLLGEAVVEVKVPDIMVKGDTIEYNAGAYTRDEGSLLKDVVRGIPGIEVDRDNNITANGKPVKKILVDGKEFFGNDIALALSNLPANMINKLQLFKEESEQAKLTGFKDKEPDQVLNLVVKEELKRSVFGDARGALGSSGKYNARFMTNYMRDADQASTIGNINNASVSDYPSFNIGVDKNKNLGFNIFKQSAKNLTYGGSFRISQNDNHTKTDSNTETFLSTGNRLSKNDSNNKTKRENYGFNFNMSWDIDSLTSVRFNTYTNFSRGKDVITSENLSYTSLQDTTRGFSDNRSRSDGLYTNNNLTLSRKLNNKGRTLTFSGNHAYRKNKRNGRNYSLTKYSDGTDDKEIDHISKTDSRNNSYSLSLTYVEPFGEDHSLQVAYSFNKNYSKRIHDARKKGLGGDYNVIDSAYTRNSHTDFKQHNITVDFQGRKEKYNYSIGISLEPSSSKSMVNLGDSIIEDLKQNQFNYSPNLYFSFTPNSSTNVDFSYNGSSSQPDVRQLSADTIVVNAMTKHYGNPNLKASYNNNINISFQKSDFKSGRFFMINGSYYFTVNDIVSYTNIDSKGNTINTYRNVGGNMGANLSTSFNTPFRNKKFSVSSSTNANYSRNVGFTNEDKAITNNYSLSEFLKFKFKSDKFESEISGNISHNIASNNLSNVDNQSTTNFTLGAQVLANLPFDFTIASSINYTKYNGYGSDFKTSEVVWNAFIDKKFLKKKRGILKLQVYDILNDRSNISRTVTSNFISDYKTNTVSRYFMFSFIYKFTIGV